MKSDDANQKSSMTGNPTESDGRKRRISERDTPSLDSVSLLPLSQKTSLQTPSGGSSGESDDGYGPICAFCLRHHPVDLRHSPSASAARSEAESVEREIQQTKRTFAQWCSNQRTQPTTISGPHAESDEEALKKALLVKIVEYHRMTVARDNWCSAALVLAIMLMFAIAAIIRLLSHA